MRLYQRIIAGGLVLAGLAGLYGCKQENNTQKPAESKLEYFLDKGVIGNPDATHGRAGVGVALADMDGDGDLDMITTSPWNIKYFENIGSKTSPQYVDRGVIGNPDATHGRAGVGVALADMDGDGDLDMITTSPWNIKYFENTGKIPQKSRE